MPKRTPFNKNTYYHIYNKGFKEARLFYEDSDYKRFINNIRKYWKKYTIFLNIEQRCLLPNHFHFLVYNKLDWLDIADFMRYVQLSYAVYFKFKYWGLHGVDIKLPVFDGRYKAKKIDSDQYLKECRSYIYSNPVKHDYVKNAMDRPWQS